jgi:CHAT domain-containing protein
MKVRRTTTVAAVVLFVAGSALAQAQGTYTPPPRTVEDILAVLDQYKPDPAVAERARADLTAQSPAEGAPKDFADFYYKRALAAQRLGLLSQEINDLRRGVQYAETGRIDDRARIYEQLANAEWNGGNLINAMRLKEKIIANEASPGWKASMYSHLARILASMGDTEGAKNHFMRAENYLLEFSRQSWWRYYQYDNTGVVEGARGLLLSYEGKYKDAEPAFRRALANKDKDIEMHKTRQAMQIDPRALLTVQDSRDGIAALLAGNLRQQGRLVDAEEISRDTLLKTLGRRGKYSPRSAGVVAGLSKILFEQGRYQEAGLLARAAVDIWERIGAPPESLFLADARDAYAATLVAESRWPEALAEYEKIRAGIGREPLLVQRFHRGNNDWALALMRTGKAAEAVAMLEPMEQTDFTRGFLAMALAQQGDRRRALAAFQQTVPKLLGAIQQDEEAQSGRVARAMRVKIILEAYIALLAEVYQSQAPGLLQFDLLGESFRIADAARSSNVQRALAESAARASLPDAKVAGLARGEQDARQRIQAMSGILLRLLNAPADQQSPKLVADIQKTIDDLKVARALLRAEIESKFPDYANLIDPKPATMEQARAALRTEEALISIYVGDDKTYVWAIPKLGAPAFAVVPQGEREVTRIVAEVRKAFDVGDASIAQFPKYDVGAAYKLYSALLAPVESGWKDATSLLIVPHGALGQLPFSLLVTAPVEAPVSSVMPFEGYQQVPWLIRKAAITQLPSVNALVTLRATPQPSSERRAFVGFGDPYFSKEQQAQADRQGLPQVAMLTRGMALRNLSITKVAIPMPGTPDGAQPSAVLRNAPAIANSSMLAQLARLPDTADEIREIAQALKADSVIDVFLGVAANEKNVKTMDLSNRKVIAFATHGLVPGDLNGLEQPALALTAPDVAGIDGDGLLTMDEILGLKLNADWVVLSACNTASGDGAGAEAVSGLGRAFFYAGARALLVTNWPVETRSARLLTTDLFKRQSENPNLTRADALRQSMLGMMDGQGQRDASGKLQFSYAHPLFWAPFTLVGDGGR